MHKLSPAQRKAMVGNTPHKNRAAAVKHVQGQASPPPAPAPAKKGGGGSGTPALSGPPPSGGYNTKPVGGSAQIVLVLGVVLFIMVKYNDVIKPLILLTWDGKSDPIDWKGSLGIIIMLTVMVFLASISDDIGGLMLVFMLGFFMVYLIEGSSNNSLLKMIDWLSGKQPPAKSGGGTKK